MRRIVVIHGSDSDLPQCEEGLLYLRCVVEDGLAEVVEVTRSSLHRNTTFTLNTLNRYSQALEHVDVLILGAGMANHLTGTGAAYLLNDLENNKIVVVGVAFEDEKDDKHTQVAIDSIKCVPGTQVVYKDKDGDFIGSDGFLRACICAVEGKLPTLKLPEKKPHKTRSLEGAIQAIHEMKE